jgi:hypothetical protein
MTGAEAIALARRRRVRLEVFLGKLRAYSESEADEILVRLLRANEQVVVDAILAAETESDRWRHALDENVETIVKIRGLTRPDAEREAFQHVVVEYSNETHPNSDPTRCGRCGGPETPDATLLPFGWGERPVWLHGDCWGPWRARRREVAVAELAAMKIEEP